jgi:uncharacterized membrane protein YhaH (DUF805 family)
MIDIKPFFSFDGKSKRSEYWAVNLCSYVILLVSGLLSALIMMSGIFGAISGVLLIIATAVALAWLVFAVTARRCRDIGISPWFTLSLLIPYLAIIPFIVIGCLKSEVKDEHCEH